MKMPRVLVFDHLDNRVCELSPNEVFMLTRTEEINGTNSLEINSSQPLAKEQRVLVRDMMGIWREYVVIGVDEAHLSGRHATGTYYCEWSLKHDLQGVVVEDKRPGAQSPVLAAVALEALLSYTSRWAVGSVTVTGSGGTSLYWESAWEGLGQIVDEWGGEIRADISVSSTGVIARELSLLEAVGNQTAKRRFEFGYDMTGIQRRVEEEPLYCRVYPRGKGEETDSGGYGRRITIESVNNGVAYIENEDTAQAVRLPDGAGGFEYPSCVIVNDQIDDPQALKDWGEEVLDDYTTPKVTYTGTVEQFGAAGMSTKGVSLGDAVQCADREFTPTAALRVNGRVVKIIVDERDPKAAKLTIGYVTDGLAGLLGNLGKTIAATVKTVAAMNGGTMSTDAYLERLLSRLNAEINANGGYAYITEGHGILTYDTAVSDPLVGAEASQVVEIKGGSIRIANTRMAQGEWDWRSVFTSGHIAADMVTAVSIIAGFIGSPSGNYWNLDTGVLTFDHGIISNADGTSYWNMTTGEVCLGASASINGSTAGSITNDIANLKLTAQQFSVDMQSLSTSVDGTNKNVSNLTLRADAFDVSINGLKATYATCSTAAATQTKVVNLSNFASFTGQTVTVKFTYKNTASEPILKVQNSDGTVVASGYIYVNNAKMAEHQYWSAQGVVTFVWDGTYWRVGDGETVSKIKVLQDSITLSVSNATLGNTASIVLSVNGSTQTKDIDLTGVRNAFKNDTTAITITAGTVTFNSNTFVVNSDNFSVTKTGVITATSGTIGGLTIAQNSLYNAKMTLDSDGLTLKNDTYTVGDIGTSQDVNDNTKKSLNFHLNGQGAYMTWAARTGNSGTYTRKLTYANKTFGDYTAGRLYIECESDFKNNIAHNLYIDPNTGGADGGVTGTYNYVASITTPTFSLTNNSGIVFYKNGVFSTGSLGYSLTINHTTGSIKTKRGFVVI